MGIVVLGAIVTKHKIFHYPGCKYVSMIKPNNIVRFANKDEARKCGYRCCNYCSKLIKYYEEDKARIDKYMRDNQLKMYIEDDAMMVDNIHSSWKITPSPGGLNLILYHANTESYNRLEKRNGHLIHHYHVQKYRGQCSIIAMLEYIVEHDKWKENDLDSYKKLPRYTKKQRKAYNKAAKAVHKVKTRNLCNLIDKVSLEMAEEKKKNNKRGEGN